MRQRLFGPSPIIEIDRRGFVWLGGVKLCRYIAERQTLQFMIKDKRLASDLGTSFIEIKPDDLTARLLEAVEV